MTRYVEFTVTYSPDDPSDRASDNIQHINPDRVVSVREVRNGIVGLFVGNGTVLYVRGSVPDVIGKLSG